MPLFSCLPRDKPHPKIIINNSPAALENIFLGPCKLSYMKAMRKSSPKALDPPPPFSLRFHTRTHPYYVQILPPYPCLPLPLLHPSLPKDKGGCFWGLFFLSLGGESLVNNDFSPGGGLLTTSWVIYEQLRLQILHWH